ncbi:PA2169 family four-helix-bundle protein [Flavobacterium sp. Fl-77]|uniref:PA2169 family four-helix-bundle protein n=1 Tax=Flavobacterium flavipigmentatum TaxID=2893884 RepID=A0AAJ2VXY5_9FLAO|nr:MULTISPECIES: PA2169 family four-helix-bundle protein [unclassified Flavobacterium]MDX6183863.1 PA2169 family four-helix-bundle protein [Flavobacterium sp. Fl-33]MDX6187392.1 PA2169 family four-helix-bundle protein [Flavobacterium sp. Fl-77]UFH40296.1 PA2169 family four-helix-bundle protein [Flavobacterium sp. F-70]
MIHTEETTKETVSTLNGLIAILEDGKLGYTNAAEQVSSPAIKTDFLEYARERALFIVELQDEINKLGKSTDTAGGGPLGALHRAWIDIKSSFTSGDTEAIINACITGEEAAIEKYKMVLEEKDLPTGQIAIVSKQLNSIQNTLIKIKAKKLLS